ncbi:(Fe-S)-binding protein [Heyndrickxia vini]|uniref:Glycolate oxidase iron-sulfur subunit n=1 Tax=Heyndrickxia vini TaxID=1476025 RepID=A0ABX7DXC7_9BACI|nr:(Fe-S)-binding protein [Heyndrickxia vini]QQZ07720.1 (Fe-S)-binding protein [Heyndrickxia vini]
MKKTSLNPVVKNLHDKTYNWTNQCVQCGYCLPVCPTYESMGKESASPRGRINLVKMAAEGKIDISEHMAEPIELCLGCRACEIACPVGVPYGHMLEAAKDAIAQSKQQKRENSHFLLKNMAMNQLFPYPNRMKFLGSTVWLYKKSKLDRLIRKTKLFPILSEPLAQMEKILPPLENPSKRLKHGTVFPAKGERKVRVAFFTGCIMDSIMYKVNRLSIELLTSVGCEVVIPNHQTCCGALHAHQGATEKAKELAKANIQSFTQSEAEFYVNNAGGCGAALSEYDYLLKGDEEWAETAGEFAKKSRDISQILTEYGPLPFIKEWKGIVVYQDSCHLRNVQKVYQEPRQLLQSIPGITYVEMEGANRCCASGGIYNLLHFQESMKILDKKMKEVIELQPKAVITTNPGCQLQMSLGIDRMEASENIRSMHLVEILAEACGLT